jgi:hypothetical protein
MRQSSIVLVCVVGLVATMNLGCAGRATARDSARRLQASIGLYEQHLEAFTAKQTQYYKSRQEEQQRSRKELAIGQLGELQINLASKAAEVMIADPTNQARPSKLTEFLSAAYEQQTALAAMLEQAQRDDARTLENKIAALEAKKALAEKIRLNLSSLAGDSSLANETSDLKDYSVAVKTEIDKLRKEK